MNKNMNNNGGYFSESEYEYEYASGCEAEEYEEYCPLGEEYVPFLPDPVASLNPMANWDDDDFELSIPKVSVPKVSKVSKIFLTPTASAASVEIKAEAEPEAEPEVDLTKFLNWGKPRPVTVERVEAPETDVDFERFLNWGQSKVGLAEEPKAEVPANLEFPPLDRAREKPAPEPKFKIGKSIRFVKFDLAEAERECMNIVARELEIVNVVTTTKLPNLYLNKRKSRDYCESAARGYECRRREDCRAAHSLEDYLPRRCPMPSSTCKEKKDEMSTFLKKKVEDCKLKHDDESLESFLLRIKLINTFMYKRLNEVRDQNKAAFKCELNETKAGAKKNISEKKNAEPRAQVAEYVPSHRNFSSYLDALRCDLPQPPEEETPQPENSGTGKTAVLEGVLEAMAAKSEEEKEWTLVEKKKKEAQAKDVRTEAIGILSDASKIEKTLSKTQLCRHWQKNGRCPKGDKCGFAHGKEELKVAVCIFGARCNRKETCKFAHPGRPDNRSQAFEVLADSDKVSNRLVKTQMCRHWQKNGRCPMGDKCGYAHGKEELQPAKCFFGAACRKKSTCRFLH